MEVIQYFIALYGKKPLDLLIDKVQNERKVKIYEQN